MRNIFEIILNIDLWFWRKCVLKIFIKSSGILLFDGAEPQPFVQFWQRAL